MKRWISLCLCFLLCLGLIIPALLVVPVSADVTASGTTGDLSWSVEDSILYLTGAGEPDSYTSSGPPWAGTISGVVIGDRVSTLSKYLFANCNVGDLIIPDTVTKYGSYAFSYSTGSSIVLNNTVSSLSSSSFTYCSVDSVYLSETISSLGTQCFYKASCDIYLPSVPPTLGTSALASFTGKLYVPYGCLNIYSSAEGWSSYASVLNELPPAYPSVPNISASFEGQTIRIDSGSTIDFYITAFGANGTVTCEYYINGEPYGEVFPFYVFGNVREQFMQAWRYTPVGDGIREIYAVVSNTVGSNVVTVTTGSCTVIVGDVSGGDDSGGGSSGDDSEVVGKLDSLEQEMVNLQGSVDDLGNKVDGIQGTVDDMAGNIEQLPEDFENALEQSHQNEKNEALQSGDDGAQEVIDIIPNPSDEFLPAIRNLVSVMSYDGTAAVLTMPAVSIPKIGSIVPNIKLLDAQEIDFSEYVTLFPDLILNFIRALFDSALVIYCLYELFTMIGSALSGFIKNIGKGDLYE